MHASVPRGNDTAQLKRFCNIALLGAGVFSNWGMHTEVNFQQMSICIMLKWKSHWPLFFFNVAIPKKKQ